MVEVNSESSDLPIYLASTFDYPLLWIQKSNQFSTSDRKFLVYSSLHLLFASSTYVLSVYKIPPLKANVGHRAGEWGDLAQPLWKGRIRVIELSNSVFIQFEDSQTGEYSILPQYFIVHKIPFLGECTSILIQVLDFF